MTYFEFPRFDKDEVKSNEHGGSHDQPPIPNCSPGDYQAQGGHEISQENEVNHKDEHVDKDVDRSNSSGSQISESEESELIEEIPLTIPQDIFKSISQNKHK